jgi:hypothetical protein
MQEANDRPLQQFTGIIHAINEQSTDVHREIATELLFLFAREQIGASIDNPPRGSKDFHKTIGIRLRGTSHGWPQVGPPAHSTRKDQFGSEPALVLHDLRRFG